MRFSYYVMDMCDSDKEAMASAFLAGDKIRIPVFVSIDDHGEEILIELDRDYLDNGRYSPVAMENLEQAGINEEEACQFLDWFDKADGHSQIKEFLENMKNYSE